MAGERLAPDCALRHAVWTTEKVGSSSSEILEKCPYFVIIPKQTGLAENEQLAASTVTVVAFLWMADAQSGFEGGIRRIQIDYKPGVSGSTCISS